MFCRNQEKSEINELELKSLQAQDASEIAGSSNDTTRLLEDQEEEQESVMDSSLTNELTTTNVVIFNPIMSSEDSSNSHGEHSCISEQNMASSVENTSIVEANGGKDDMLSNSMLNGPQVTIEKINMSKLKSLMRSAKRSTRTFLKDLAVIMW